MSFLRMIAGAVLTLVTAALTFLGVFALALMAFPAEMEREINIQSIPFSQWTMQELNLVLGAAVLIFVAIFLAGSAALVVWNFVEGSQ